MYIYRRIEKSMKEMRTILIMTSGAAERGWIAGSRVKEALKEGKGERDRERER